MASFSLFFGLPIFLTLPAPFKFILIMLSGFSILGFRANAVKMEQVDVIERAEAVAEVHKAPAGAAPELVAPKVPQKVPAPAKVTMNVNGEFVLNGEKVSEVAMAKKLKAMAKANPQQKVMLEADARAPVQLIANAMKLCKSAGVTNVTFAAKAGVSVSEPEDSP